jgi:hypothetical protein
LPKICQAGVSSFSIGYTEAFPGYSGFCNFSKKINLFIIFFYQIKHILRVPLLRISVTLLYARLYAGADGLIRIFTFPHSVIKYCKETAQTRHKLKIEYGEVQNLAV